ncbi:TerB family tellurite resistance protein [Zavarzinella formosa]|uniref:TerB family tellurite resistance protein n=1 Tax=Zavarzinella formosa TaxID=360055 RepID=UPI0003108A19|nr:TerB family tellurite resistance protein [Zavarzinella formosa]
MPTVIIIVLVTLALIVAALYVRYALTPEFRWKRELAKTLLATENKSRAAREALQRLESSRQAARDEMEHHLADRIHASMNLDVLTEHPGIGDATVKRLRDAGILTIAELRRINLTSVDGLGPARIRDLQTALNVLQINATRRAKDPNDALVRQAITRHHEQDRLFGLKIAEAEGVVRQADALLNRLQSRREISRRINFLTHLWLPHRFPHLSESQLAESFETPLPEPKPIPIPVPPPQTPSPQTPSLIQDPPAAKPPLPHAPPTPIEILRAIAGLGLAIAKADGRVAASERKQLGLFLERRFAPMPELKAALPALTATESAEILSLSDALADVKRLVPSPQFSDIYLMACSVADAAGDRNAKEIACLAEVKTALGLSDVPTPKPAEPPIPVNVPKAESSTSPEMTDASARQTLEICENIPLSADLIRRQFRLLSERYEHSRFASTDAEFARLAEVKRKSVRTAAEWLIRAFDVPLEPPDQPKPPADDRYNPDLDAVFGG